MELIFGAVIAFVLVRLHVASCISLAYLDAAMQINLHFLYGDQPEKMIPYLDPLGIVKTASDLRLWSFQRAYPEVAELFERIKDQRRRRA